MTNPGTTNQPATVPPETVPPETEPRTVMALAAPPRKRDNPLTRSVSGLVGGIFLLLMIGACVLTLPYTLAGETSDPTPRFNAGEPRAGRLPPSWIPADAQQRRALNALVAPETVEQIAGELDLAPDEVVGSVEGEAARRLASHHPHWLLGTDKLGRSLFMRVLTGGGISLTIGIAAALVSVAIGTIYGVIAGYAGGRIDSVMMRIVDILYGLPYILLVVLLAVAVDAMVEQWISDRVEHRGEQRSAYVEQQLAELPEDQRAGARETLSIEALDRYGSGELTDLQHNMINIATLLVAIGGVSWLTMARVIRGQVLSLKAQPFMEAARAIGVPLWGQFARHLLPNLLGPIVVYATLTVPQAILQESFLSFLGIGVRPPLPSWGNLAAEGLTELNTHRSDWWQLFFPCALLGLTLLALNFVGEGLREALDPRRSK